MKKLINKKGFTLLEVFLSIAILGIIAGIGFPFYMGLQTRTDLQTATIIASQTLRRAQSLSQAMDQGSDWGVHVETGSIIMFKGTTYELRDDSFDEIYTISPLISAMGSHDVVFERMTGHTNAITIMFRISDTLFSNISVNEKGIIEY